MVGLDVEIVERFAAYLGKELSVQDMEFGSLIPAAASKKIDMVASTLVITEERQKQVLAHEVLHTSYRPRKKKA